MKNLKREKGITLVVLVVTIIILLILAGITINSLTGSGLFEKAQLAKNETENAQIDEDKKVKEYNDKINQYISNGREQVTVDKEEYEQLKKDVDELKNIKENIKERIKIETKTPSKVSEWQKIADFPEGYNKENSFVNFNRITMGDNNDSWEFNYGDILIQLRSDGIYMAINDTKRTSKTLEIYLEKI